jgi:molybdate transport system substrate-binding protein
MAGPADLARPPLRVLSTLAFKGAMAALEAGYVAGGGAPLEVTFGPTNALTEAIGSGVRGDVAILTRDGTAPLVNKAVLHPCVDIAHSYVGLAVKAGAPLPDIGTPDALVATLHAAKSVAFSRIGASGIYFAGLIDRLGLTDMMKAKSIVVPGGFTGEAVAAGRADLAIQQVSELKVVPGVTVVGPLPKALQDPVVFSVGVFRQSTHAAADAFQRYLAGSDAAALLAASGLEPIPV